MKTRTQGILGVAAAQTLLGSIGLCVLESGADSVSAAFYRCAIGGLMLAFYCLWRRDLAGLLRLPARTLTYAVASGFLMIANWVLFFEGIHRTGIAVATILFHVQPFLSWFSEPWSSVSACTRPLSSGSPWHLRVLCSPRVSPAPT
ncbi:EamA family transporter [Roseibium salinum]|uniref:EamA family transporter n=1 Tax=Roseibium salinum TaxID=1604349 RepID=UPI003610D112